MPIETELREVPDNIEIRCPQCGNPSKRIDIGKDIYECPNCLLQFEAIIELSWDSQHYISPHSSRQGGGK